MQEEKFSRPGMAAVFSFIFNGLGQLYNGDIAKGLLIIFFSSLSLLVLIAGAIFAGFWMSGRVVFEHQLAWGAALFITGLVFICVIGIYSIIDAYNCASKK